MSGASGTLDPVEAARADIAQSRDLIASVEDDLHLNQRWFDSYRISERRHARRLKRLELFYRLQLGWEQFARVSKRTALSTARDARDAYRVLRRNTLAAAAWAAPRLDAANLWIAVQAQRLGATLYRTGRCQRLDRADCARRLAPHRRGHVCKHRMVTRQASGSLALARRRSVVLGGMASCRVRRRRPRHRQCGVGSKRVVRAQRAPGRHPGGEAVAPGQSHGRRRGASRKAIERSVCRTRGDTCRCVAGTVDSLATGARHVASAHGQTKYGAGLRPAASAAFARAARYASSGLQADSQAQTEGRTEGETEDKSQDQNEV